MCQGTHGTTSGDRALEDAPRTLQQAPPAVQRRPCTPRGRVQKPPGDAVGPHLAPHCGETEGVCSQSV